MTSSRNSFATRRRSTVVSIVSFAAVLAMTACGSADSTDTTPAADGSLVDASPVESAAPDVSATSTTGTVATEAAGTGDPAAICGGLSAADVGAAAGVGNFDSADDLSVDADVTCLFSNSTSVFGITVSTEPTASFLAGELDGLSIEESLAELESTQTLFLEPGYTAERIVVAGTPAVVVTGIDLVQGEANGFAATVIDGVVHTATASGTDLGTEPASFSPIVTTVLELAVGAQQ